MDNKAYWAQRMKMLEKALHKKGYAYVQNLENQFDRAVIDIEKELAAWYMRFAKNNNISFSEAKRLLNTRELSEFRMSVQEYIEKGSSLDPKWVKQLENASARFHISRLESIEVQLQQKAEELYGNQLDGLSRVLKDIYTEGYYHTAFELVKGIGLGYSLMSIDDNSIEKVLSKPWSADMRTFRDRCWVNKEALVNSVNTHLTQMIMRGQAPDKAIKAIAKDFGVSKSKAGRLVMTESAAFASTSQKDCFNELDVEKYQIIETLDSNTCELCADLDGKVFNMSEFQVGSTAPPFHPWCRGTTAPYFDDWEEFGLTPKRAARDPNTGKTVLVDDMTYKEWKDKFVKAVEKPNESGIIQTSKAAHSPTRNTGKLIKYNPDADFSITLDGYSPEVNFGLSNASAEVARLSGNDNLEHMSLVNLKTGAIEFSETGDGDSVGGSAFFDFINENKDSSFAFVHSHTTDGYFSEADMRTLLGNNSINMFIATRVDGIKYIAEVANKPPNMMFDFLYEKELSYINNLSRLGKISSGERTHLREETIVDNLLKDYTKGLIEIDGSK